MKMTERFTRLNKDFLIYTITVDDPVVLTDSWTARFPLKLDNSFQVLEYACTEDNNMIPHWISTSRAERAQEAAKAAGGQQKKEQ
jgi:exoribonuclease II